MAESLGLGRMAESMMGEPRAFAPVAIFSSLAANVGVSRFPTRSKVDVSALFVFFQPCGE
jgi:hypothetical protein